MTTDNNMIDAFIQAHGEPTSRHDPEWLRNLGIFAEGWIAHKNQEKMPLEVELQRLRTFIGHLFYANEYPEYLELDGFDFEEICIRYNILVPQKRKEFCGQDCFCETLENMENGFICNRFPDWLMLEIARVGYRERYASRLIFSGKFSIEESHAIADAVVFDTNDTDAETHADKYIEMIGKEKQ